MPPLLLSPAAPQQSVQGQGQPTTTPGPAEQFLGILCQEEGLVDSPAGSRWAPKQIRGVCRRSSGVQKEAYLMLEQHADEQPCCRGLGSGRHVGGQLRNELQESLSLELCSEPECLCKVNVN
uniref:Uncharacterized protein n=1 Tax=Sphaerodactylus townsendi TaxID=933632 RepID=A0ACB8FHU1_9SAUR